ncbi:uncharacterized protein DS421_16g533060 [Arachis hypogaea]|nr:uncharacterized protein DS421_16g533060 [Arachis hypogaea]
MRFEGKGGGKGTAARRLAVLPHRTTTTTFFFFFFSPRCRYRSSLLPPLFAAIVALLLGKRGKKTRREKRGEGGFGKKRGKGKGPRRRHRSSRTSPLFAIAATAAPPRLCWISPPDVAAAPLPGSTSAPADPRGWTSCAGRRFCSSSLLGRRGRCSGRFLVSGFLWFLLVLLLLHAYDYQSGFCVVVVLLIPLSIEF